MDKGFKLLAAALIATLFATASSAQDAAQVGAGVGAGAEAPASVPMIEQPLWELGFAAAAGYAPHYPAAEQSSGRFIAVPVIIYRGDFLRLGDESIARGVFVDKPWVEFDISLAGSFNVDSDSNDARDGMPDLDFLGEIGPNVKFKLGQIGPGLAEISLPVRAVFSTDLSSGDFRGVAFNPRLIYKIGRVGGTALNLAFSAESTFATERLHDYFYQVDTRFATPDRPAYDAQAGYLGSALGLSASYPVNARFALFSDGRLNYYGGAKNEDSPLHLQDVNASIWAGFRWSLYQSEETVRRPLR
ncbi:MAG: MipA/OmpV family protein [Neomegalonema sp.]|nr:MipA/OmpV family protein [Neomegalonema sp.]